MSSPAELDPLVLRAIEGSSVLDVACGRGKWGYLLRTNWWVTKNGNGREEPSILVGVDMFLPFLKKVKYHKVYDFIVCCHVSYLPFRDNSFDSVIASEIIEHMEKENGRLLLKEIERVSKKGIVITTPNILRKRGGLHTPEGFNPYEQHITPWTISELRFLGYKVRGVFAAIPKLSWIISPISYVIPRLSTHIVATKYKDREPWSTSF